MRSVSPWMRCPGIDTVMITLHSRVKKALLPTWDRSPAEASSQSQSQPTLRISFLSEDLFLHRVAGWVAGRTLAPCRHLDGCRAPVQAPGPICKNVPYSWGLAWVTGRPRGRPAWGPALSPGLAPHQGPTGGPGPASGARRGQTAGPRPQPPSPPGTQDWGPGLGPRTCRCTWGVLFSLYSY